MKGEILIIVGVILFTSCTNNAPNDVVSIAYNSSLKTIQYVNPNDSSIWSIKIDSNGNPIGFQSKNKDTFLRNYLSIDYNGFVTNLEFYSIKNEKMKMYCFSDFNLKEITEFNLVDTQYLANQWRYLTENENTDDNKGFFIEMEIEDTIDQMTTSFATIELKGRKGLRGISYIINGDTMKTNSRIFKTKLNTTQKGINTFSGYVSNFDTTMLNNKDATIEFRASFNKRYYVK